MTTRFDGMNLREAQALYRESIMRVHPDRGGTTEAAAKLNAEWQAFTSRMVNEAFAGAEAEREGKTRDYSATVFADILRKVVKFDIDVEIIGFWIYAFRSFEYRQELAGLGFWFSGKHKAWIYSGGAKAKRKGYFTTDQNRAKWGSQRIASEFVEKDLLPA
jgi:hypothetical protein